MPQCKNRDPKWKGTAVTQVGLEQGAHMVDRLGGTIVGSALHLLRQSWYGGQARDGPRYWVAYVNSAQAIHKRLAGRSQDQGGLVCAVDIEIMRSSARLSTRRGQAAVQRHKAASYLPGN